MNRIGFTILFFLAVISCKTPCQNFFWSHTQGYEIIKYGYLYNWYATQGTGSNSLTSSDDWVIPTSTQRNTLTTYLGGNSVAGGHMKEIGLTWWDSPNTGADNSSGFNGRAGGVRQTSYTQMGATAEFWCSNQVDASNANGFRLASSSASLTNTAESKIYGKSIRLLYTGAGSPSIYTGNDGTIYRIILIGSQYWLADNLAETKYRDGTTITVVTDQSTWNGLSTEARCVYDNNESNR